MSNALRKFKRQKGRKKVKIATLDTVLVDMDDKPARDGGYDFTLRRAMKGALGNALPSDNASDAKAKEHCYDLMMQVKQANGEIELDAEDVAIIKKRIAEMYPPWVVGQAARLIESKE